MGDIHPYGAPYFYSRAQVYGWIATLNGPHPDPDIFTAIAEAESGFDKAVIYDNPPSGDYSVGLWQINYYGHLYAERAAEFGTPAQLIGGGIARQAFAAVTIWRQQGLSAWGSYINGRYRKFLAGTPGAPAAVAPGQQTAPLPTDINPPTEDYSATIGEAADQVTAVNQSLLDAATALRGLRDTNPHG